MLPIPIASLFWIVTIAYEMACSDQFIDVEQEFEKNSELKREDIAVLRKFVDTQYPKTSDFQLFLFLHSCYYDVEAAKNTIDSYYRLRSRWPEVFRSRNPTVAPLRDNLSVSVTWPLKQCTKEGYTVVYARLIDCDDSHYDVDQQVKQFFITAEYWLRIVGNGKGFITIFDATGLTWGHLPKLGINVLRKLLEYVQEGFPIRLKGVHYINTGVVVEKILMLVRMFMEKEMHDITHVHSDLESLYKHVSKSSMPKDFGGDDVSVQELHEDMINTLVKNAELFQEDDAPFEETDKRETFSYIDAF